MTRFVTADGCLVIKWDSGDPVDLTTPNIGNGPGDEYCGNCGLDYPGCGCPRDDLYQRDLCGFCDAGLPMSCTCLPVQLMADPPLPWRQS